MKDDGLLFCQNVYVSDFRVIEAHPSLGHAAMLVAAAVSEEVVSGGGATGGSSSGVVTLFYQNKLPISFIAKSGK